MLEWIDAALLSADVRFIHDLRTDAASRDKFFNFYVEGNREHTPMSEIISPEECSIGDASSCQCTKCFMFEGQFI